MRLFIYLSWLAIGKIHGQEVNNPQFINEPFLSEPVQLISRDGRTWLAIVKAPDLNWSTETVRHPNPIPQAYYVDRSALSLISSSLSPPTEDTQKNSTQNPDTMNRPTTESAANTSVDNASQNNSGNHKTEENYQMPEQKPPSQVPASNQNAMTGEKAFVLPPVLNVTAVNPASNETFFQPLDKNGTKITFDERSSFEVSNRIYQSEWEVR